MDQDIKKSPKWIKMAKTGKTGLGIKYCDK